MLTDVIQTLLRRWIFVLLAVVAAGLAGVGAWTTTPVQYESQAQVLFLPPSLQPDVKGGRVNPFLVLGKAVTVTADIVRIDVSDTDTRTTLAARGALPGYEVITSVAQNGGPILLVTVTGDSGVDTQRTMDLVVEEISTTLRRVQRAASAPTDSFISATQLTATPAAQPVTTRRIRLAFASAGAVLLLLLPVIVLGDRWGRRRRRRRVSSVREQAETPGSVGPATSASGLAVASSAESVEAGPTAPDPVVAEDRRVAMRQEG